MNRPPRILAVRASKTQTDTLELLCLHWGINKRFRIYTTTDEDLSESVWELDPVEFDLPGDAGLATYLIESLWLLEISDQELDAACILYADGFAEAPTAIRHKGAIAPLGSLGVLLIEALNRTQTLEPSDRESPESWRRIERRLGSLAKVPTLPAIARDLVNDCLTTCQVAAAEALQRRL